MQHNKITGDDHRRPHLADNGLSDTVLVKLALLQQNGNKKTDYFTAVSFQPLDC